MARVYATAADYQTYTGQTPPTDITTQLTRASQFLETRVLRTYRYDVDTAGMPTDTAVIGAVRDAVCAQVRWWVELGDSIGAAGAGWGDIRIGSVQLSRLSSTHPNYPGEASPARQVAPQVWDALGGPDVTPDRFRLLVSTGGGSGTGWGW